jgi:hypothetical protein
MRVLNHIAAKFLSAVLAQPTVTRKTSSMSCAR